MADQATLSLGKVSQVLNKLYGSDVRCAFDDFRSSNGLSENVTVYRDAPHDGEVTIRTQDTSGGHPLAGVLRFRDNGTVESSQVFNPFWDARAENSEQWTKINSVLIALSFGVEELNRALAAGEVGVLVGAKEFYRNTAQVTEWKTCVETKVASSDDRSSEAAQETEAVERPQREQRFPDFSAEAVRRHNERFRQKPIDGIGPGTLRFMRQ